MKIALAQVILLIALVGVACAGQLPWSQTTFDANEGWEWSAEAGTSPLLDLGAHYIAPPADEVDWAEWLVALREWRETSRKTAHSLEDKILNAHYDGVRAWIRLGREASWAAALQPGEQIILRGEARWLAGPEELLAAFDYCDRSTESRGQRQSWSMTQATTKLLPDGEWHEFELTVTVPAFDTTRYWARPIFGFDATYDPAPGQAQLRNLQLEVPDVPGRLLPLVESPKPGFDNSLYTRPDLLWSQRNFVCGFLMVWDEALWDADSSRWRVEEVLEEAKREFGGWDSVVLWPAYPRIGADQRNQFDFCRDLPGGLAGLREVVGRFHTAGVKVFLPYNPWDTGTRREPVSDEVALAELAAATNCDGLFLDTMLQAPPGLREEVDARRPGVVFEPEGWVTLEEQEHCTSSWAQWAPEPGVLRSKWLEPRHMQHAILRWNASHQDELASAWLNGSGVLVWENIFGAWNPWRAEDRATLRRMAPLWRQFASLLAEGEWLPCLPTGSPALSATLWQAPGTRLWCFEKKGEGGKLTFQLAGEHLFDLWTGQELPESGSVDQVWLDCAKGRFGAVLAIAPELITPELYGLLRHQRAEAKRPVPAVEQDSHLKVLSLEQPRSVPQVIGAPHSIDGLLPITGGRFQFDLAHVRRECGCYPDPGTPAEELWSRFLGGWDFQGLVEHHLAAEVAPGFIDPRPVTNGEFEAFLAATGYRPTCATNFLKHWGGPRCPAELRDEPVVYVELTDARAFAAWAGKRLPTEWEWQRGAEEHPGDFLYGQVWEWTESERDDGHNRFVMLRGGCEWRAEGTLWYFPTGPQPLNSHAKFLLMYPGYDRCATIGFRCITPR